MALATTGTATIAALPTFIRSQIADTAEQLAAVNAAIQRSSPAIKLNERSTSVATLTAQTFTYSLSAVTLLDSELGVGRVEIQISDSTIAPPSAYREVRQFYDQSSGAWSLWFSAATINAYVGKVVNIEYQYPHPLITDLANAVYLPQDYLVSFIIWWIAADKTATSTKDNTGWRDLMISSQENYEKALRRHQTMPLSPPVIITGKDQL